MTELINTQELIKLIRAVVRDEFKRHGLSASKKQNTEIKSRQSAPTATSEEKRLFKNITTTLQAAKLEVFFDGVARAMIDRFSEADIQYYIECQREKRNQQKKKQKHST